MAKRIESADITRVLGEQFDAYNKRLTANVNSLSEAAAKALAEKTRKTAPKRKGDFRKAIASALKEKRSTGNTYMWFVKPPHYRLTHLLVHGHAVRGGGRTRPNPFLEDAYNEVIPSYEEAVVKAAEEI